MPVKPKKVTLRTYQVGFGDCILMILEYSDGSEKFVLFDFGTTALPKSLGKTAGQWLKMIADDIKARCSSQLDIVVATHRHADHILGFSTDNDSGKAGLVIRSCKPKLVVQPWTEDPKLPEDAEEGRRSLVGPAEVKAASERSYSLTLLNMQAISGAIVDEAKNVRSAAPAVAEQIEFIGLDNVSNESAVKNLGTMGKNVYISYGFDLNAKIKTILPGIKVEVLGPPTLKQHPPAGHEAPKNASEYWPFLAMAQNYWSMQAATSEMSSKNISAGKRLFPNASVYSAPFPSRSRWFVRRMRKLRADQLLSIATTMDDALNNTSLILLFEIGGKKFLFPGDAQIENWEYCLKFADDKATHLKRLADTYVYKVGHHGSTNATPQTLYKDFANKKTNPNADPDKIMTSVISTMGDENGKFKHGNPDKGTEVPRSKLINALKDAGELKSTRDLTASKDLFFEVEFEL